MPAAGADNVCGTGPQVGGPALRGPEEASCARGWQAAQSWQCLAMGTGAAQVSRPEGKGPSSRCGNSIIGFQFENCHLDVLHQRGLT